MNNFNQIEQYSFGNMKINGTVYQQDVIVFPKKVLSGWWRREGHSLSEEDLKQVLDYHPDVLIVGTGASGMLRVPETTRKTLRKMNIQVMAQKTDQAVECFNEHIEKGRNAVGAFHLTC
jgi:hypothetical protein